MKKVVACLLVLLFSFSFISCTSKEYVVSDDLLTVSSSVEDNNRVYYEIFLGAFSDSNDDGIGDLQGLINRLDYLNDGDPNSGKSLGIEGIWLMPIMPSPSYHKYDVTNYESIDDDYGTIDDFTELIEECDARGIDVIIDLVLNHTSNQHPWFRAAKQALIDGDMDNQYLDYYVIVTQDEEESGKAYAQIYGDYYYECNFSTSMPELNLDSENVRNEIVSIITYWYNLGVHGFRLDAVKYAYLNDEAKNIEFWSWFASECRKIEPDTYLVGEDWSSESYVATYYQCFSAFDFGMSQQDGAIASTANCVEDVNWYVDYIASYRSLVESYNADAILTPFISNHDMNRAAGYLSVSDGRMQMAANLYILTYGTPFIYYGEEIGLKGSRSPSENTDANRRLKMLWGDKDTVEDPIGATYPITSQTNGTVKEQLKDSDSIFNHYKKLIMLRNANPEIAHGEYTALEFTGYSCFGGFLSTYNDSTVGVFHNTSMSPVTIDLSQYTTYEFTTLRGYVGAGTASLSGQTLTIDGLTSVVLK